MIARRRLRPLTATIVLLIAACGGSDDAGPSATTTTDEAETSVPASAATTDAPPSTDAPSEATRTPPATVAPTTAPTPTPTTTPTTTTPTTPAPATSADAAPWEPIGAGPFEVGVTTVTVDDPAGERPLTVDVWFPLADDVDTAASAAHQYTLLPGVYYESPNAFTATADQIANTTPQPLVVYSHGSGGIRYLHSSFTEALASWGYVVVAPDHTGNTVIELFAGAPPAQSTLLDRPTDVGRLITAFTDTTDPVAGPFAGAVDAERVAVAGHSLGGYTAIAVAAGVTTDFGEVPVDERVDAIVALAPATPEPILPDERLASLDVPTMIVVGTDDATTPVDPNVTRWWDVTSNSPAYRVELVAGEHQTFTDLCAYSEFLPSVADVPEIILTTIEELGREGCSEGDIDAERATDITNTYVLEFLDQVLRDGPPIDESLVAPPDDVIFERR